MKTNAAFKSLVGLAVATAILASQSASAQLKSSVASKRSTSLKTNVVTAAPPVAPKKLFTLSVAGTAFSLPEKEDNFIETDITGAFALAENFSLNLDTGFESYFTKQENNNGYDLEISANVSDLPVVSTVTFSPGLIAVLPTSRDAHNKGMTGGWGAYGNFGAKVGDVGLGLENRFYQYTYKNNDIPTPAEGDDVKEDLQDRERFFTGLNSVAYTQATMGIPLGAGFKLKLDSRYRVKTPYIGDEIVQLRARTRIAYAITDALGVQAGVYWQKKLSDPKSPSMFSSLNRGIVLTMSLDI